MKAYLLWFVTFAGTCASAHVEAGMITLSAVQSGRYNELGGANLPGSENYLVGHISGREHHNFFVFDLTSVTDTIIAAELRIDGGTSGGSTVQFVDVMPSNISHLLAGTGGVPVYGDLGIGQLFGGGPAPINTLTTFTLNADAIANLNTSLGNHWAVGGRVVGSFYAFGDTGADNTRQLVLTTASQEVPEPASLTLFLVGAVGLGGGLWRRPKMVQVH